MIFTPVIFALATILSPQSKNGAPNSISKANASTGYDRYGFPILKPGLWLVTTTVRVPKLVSEGHRYCVPQADAARNLIVQFLAAQPDGGYKCQLSGGANGSGSASCSRLSQSYTGMTTIANLTWTAMANRLQTSFQTNVVGNVKFSSADPRQPSGEVPFDEMILGWYQGSCIPTPQPTETATPR